MPFDIDLPTLVSSLFFVTTLILLFQLFQTKRHFAMLLEYLKRNKKNPDTKPHDLSKFNLSSPKPLQQSSILIEELSKKYYLSRKLEKRHLRDRGQLLENIDLGILALINNEKIIFSNQQLVDYGITKKEALSPHTETSLDLIVEDLKLKNLLKRSLLKKTSLNEYFSLIGKKEFLINNSPLKNSKNKTIGMVFFFKTFDSREDLSKLKKQFLSNLSHQIKTPLTNILGYLELLQDSSELDAASKNKFIKIAYEQTHELKELTEQMLLLSKIDSVLSEELKKSTYSIDSIVHDAMDLHKIHADEKNISLNYTSALQQGKTIQTNRSLLREALGNIISNAIKYSPPDSKIEISSLSLDNQNLEISIRDFGHGMDKEEKEMIFQRFYRAPKNYLNSFDKGFGLGLPIANKIVKIHGGHIKIESELGRGSCFKVILPLC